MKQTVMKHEPKVFHAIFERYLPTRFEDAIKFDLDEDQKDKANALDYFEFHYRKYIAGQHKTLFRVYYELNIYLHFGFDKAEIMEIIEVIEKQCLQFEFYEVMDKVNSSKQKIQKLLNSFNKSDFRSG